MLPNSRQSVSSWATNLGGFSNVLKGLLHQLESGQMWSGWNNIGGKPFLNFLDLVVINF
jgi:hypothetical protein